MHTLESLRDKCYEVLMGQPMTFNPALHGLRGLAALAVLLFHWDQFYPAFGRSVSMVSAFGSQWDLSMQLHFGWLGVHLFFVLSGYLLTAQLMSRDLSVRTVRRFYFRRVMRIYPATWLQLAILLAVGAMLPPLFAMPASADLLANVLLWINMPGSMVAPINGVWWTLPIELGFYVLLPALVLLARQIGWGWLAIIVLALTLAWRFAVFSSHELDNYLPILPLLDFLPGSLNSFVLGALVSQLPAITHRGMYAVGLLMAASLLLALQYWQLSLNHVYWNGHWILVVWVPLTAIAIAAVVYFSIRPQGPLRLLATRPLVWLGEISFGLYLWHLPLLLLFRQQWPDYGAEPYQSLLLLASLLIGTVVLAAASFYAVERQAMAFKR